MKYFVSINHPERHFIQFKGEVSSNGANWLDFQLPVWRPGRYEKQNYTANLFDLQFLDDKGNNLNYEKINGNRWRVFTNNASAIKFTYRYYAAVYDGGSTFLDASELYINPVNCFFYVLGREKEHIDLDFLLPQDYIVATGLKKLEDFKYAANSFDELADCPLMASASIDQWKYTVGGVVFNVCLLGEHRLEKEVLINQFKKFTKAQLSVFESFPVTEYSFLIKIMPHRAYHGVEHCNSTVVVIGPSYSLNEESFFTEHFLGVCSHELFHTWNVKALRPAEWFPYDFSKENYSQLGYVAEGVTTYYGDLMLLRGGLISAERFLSIFSKNFNNYFRNFGRKNLSLAESSFDTWVDGYVRNFPSRKISIYNEGSLITFLLDVDIICKSNGKDSFDDVMNLLFKKYAASGGRYTEEDFKLAVEEIGNGSYTSFFENFIWGRKDYHEALNSACNLLGIELIEEPSVLLSNSHFGLLMHPGDGSKILDIHPLSPLAHYGIDSGNSVLAINGKHINNNFEDWLRFYQNETVKLLIKKEETFVEIVVSKSDETFYPSYHLKLMETPSEQQKRMFDFWLTRK